MYGSHAAERHRGMKMSYSRSTILEACRVWRARGRKAGFTYRNLRDCQMMLVKLRKGRV